MTTATQANGPAPAQQLRRSDEYADLLDKILSLPPAESYQVVDRVLKARIEKIEELLPAGVKGHAARFTRRAMLTFSGKAELQQCTADSFIRCVLQAAELGLAIDGRLCHAVPFNNKVKVPDPRNPKNLLEQWRKEAVCIPDYKGLIAIARRNRLIKDCYAEVVCEADHFEAWREGGKDHLKHRRDLTRPRGAVRAAYAIIIRPDASWRFELMDREELNKTMGVSKAPGERSRDAPVLRVQLEAAANDGLLLHFLSPAAPWS